jgi:hypothetical protein
MRTLQNCYRDWQLSAVRANNTPEAEVEAHIKAMLKGVAREDGYRFIHLRLRREGVQCSR